MGPLRTVLVALVAPLALDCASVPDDAREAEVAGVIARAEEQAIRTRPLLEAGKLNRIASAPFDFYRGTIALYGHDVRRGAGVLGERSRFSLGVPLVLSIGDAHPENFGTMRASDGAFAIEPNDFDGADRAPYLWDVRRLAAGMALASRLANAGDAAAAAVSAAAARSVARAVAVGYAQEITRLAAGGAPLRLADAQGNPIFEDLFKRSARDLANRAELTAVTVRDGGVRRLKRGVLDPESPQNTYEELPPWAYAALPDVLRAYRETLVAPPPPEYFTLLDAAREFGSGVASWAKLRVILLVRGPSDDPADDVLLELKEIVDSSIGGLYPPGVFADDVEGRVRATSRAAWARPDAEPLWGTASYVGFHVQIKHETEAFKTLRVSKLTEERGTPAALSDAATRLGALVARVHASPLGREPSPAPAIAARVADLEGFADEQADVGDAYAAQVLADYAGFQRTLARRGPTLGVPRDPSDRPSADLDQLYGAPPPVGAAP